MNKIKKKILKTKNKDMYIPLLLTSKVKDLGFFSTDVSYNYSYYSGFSEGLGIENLL
jgi:hypothetical protein